MLEEYGLRIIFCLFAILLGLILGNGSVFFFNKIPGKWLVDYGEEPNEELKHPTYQRVKSTPWKYVFSGFFIVSGIYMVVNEPYYLVPTMAVFWLMLEMSISDIKYRIIPDQLVMLLVVCGIGFMGKTNGGVLWALYGALAGFGILGIIALIGKLIFRKDIIGGGDIKILGALGLSVGLEGIILIMILTVFISSIHFLILLMLRKISMKESKPMVPYIFLSTVVYMVWANSLIFREGFIIRL